MYCSQSDLEQRYGAKMLTDLTDRAMPRAGTIDGTVVTRAITDASAEIDGYLAVRYQLPLSATPAFVNDVCMRMAIYKLHTNVVPDKINRDYDLALRSLRDISAGTMKLDLAGVEPAAASSGGVAFDSPGSRITHDQLKGFG